MRYNMSIPPRIMEIAREAAESMTISLITSSEREELARIYTRATGDEIDAWCDACIYKAAIYVYNN